MHTNLRSGLALAAALFLSACAPDGFTKSPAMGAYVQEHVVAGGTPGLDKVSLCMLRSGGWAATVIFDDGLLYDYELNLDDSTIKLSDWSTRSQRASDMSAGESPSLGCIGYYDNSAFRSFVVGGKYRLHMGRTVTAYVRDNIVVSYPFDDDVKLRLKVAGLAIQDAVARQKKFVPAETSWGLKP